MEDLILKQKAFFESGNTLDTRSRRAILQILANTIKEVASDDSDTAGILADIADIRKQVAELSVEIAEKVLRQNLKGDKAQMDLIDRILNDVSTNK